MKRNSTILAIACIIAASTNIQAQCLTGGSFTPASSNTFDVNRENFSGDFNWVPSGSGQLESTPMSAGTIKRLTSSNLFLPASATTIAWSFNLGGSANVTTYTVSALYDNGGTTEMVAICTGGSLSTTGGVLSFASLAPSAIVGKNFQLVIDFTSTSTGTKVLTIDNFKTSASVSAITLPVTIAYFGAVATTGAVKLTWMVSSESNLSRYEIERSSNGKSYSKIGQVGASGLVTYIYNASFLTGSNYYRLKAVDNDGKFKYSAVVLFKVGKQGLNARAFPSPAGDQTVLEHDIASVNTTISLISPEGRLIREIKPVAGEVSTTIDLSRLNRGLYLVRYTDGADSTTIKLIKQ